MRATQQPAAAAAEQVPLLWAAALEPQTCNFAAASDVFVLGLAMFDALSRGKRLFPGATVKSEVPARLNADERPAPLPEALCPTHVAALMARCLDAESSRRSSMDEVGEALKEAYVSGRARVEYRRERDALRGKMAEEVGWGVKRVFERADE
jgi:hypothetical protein